MKIRTMLLLSTAVLTLSACAYQQVDPRNPPAKGKIEAPVIKLKIQGNKQLEVKNSRTPNCRGSEAETKGCVITGLENIAFVRFMLEGGGQFALTNLWICDGEEKPQFKDPEDPGSLECELLGDRPNEFLVITGETVANPGANGSVDLGRVQEFFLLNQNTFQAEYFYLIEACKKDQNDNKADCTVLDPRLVNGGREVNL